MSSLLDHVCTLFIVNATTKESFLRIILDARLVKHDSIHAHSSADNELDISARSESIEQDAFLKRFVRQVLSVPPEADIAKTKFLLQRNGYLLIDVPFYRKDGSSQNSRTHDVPLDAEKVDCSHSVSKVTQDSDSVVSETNHGVCANQLDKHQTTRDGNLLTLKIPMDHAYSKDQIVVKVVNRSVCISATRVENTTTQKPYSIQRTFYKEYESSDCIPDPTTINSELVDNCLFVKVSFSRDK
ncbi:uncharacterized protein DEA37_0007713 [Paragonimus westermani]|uniref:SHSP domain-containing protein n=1 Tax=Paragonimus westermani TaxID=34504 RepID=A0A5J4NM17_9TREM|nr:uncharacterized protein DEA37_0007713 [Paragonimus westermani]